MLFPSPTRRDFLRQAAMLAIGTSALVRLRPARANAAPAPFSSGTTTPSFFLPGDACDCHMPIYDSCFPVAPTTKQRPPPATVDMYRLLQRRLGTSRTVGVTPLTYGIDNSCTLDALAQFGRTARGIAVAYGNISDADRKRPA